MTETHDHLSRIMTEALHVCGDCAAGIKAGTVAVKLSRKVNALAGRFNSAARRYVRKQDPADLAEAEKWLEQMKAAMKDVTP